MSHSHKFNIDLNKPYPNLPGAPIVEAVIHWRARAEQKLDRNALLQHLKEKLPDYPHSHPQHEVRFEGQFSPDTSSVRQHDSWHGFRFESEDKLYIAQFTRNGFVFSRLAPYQNWERFANEATRLWQIYVEFTQPSEIQRLGVRFINRIALAEMEELKDYLTVPSRCPDSLDLPIREFLHRIKLDVPGHAYNLNIIQTIQPPPPTQTEGFGFILDIDVFTTMPEECDEEKLNHRLTEMRWLKNEAFFKFLTASAIDRFKESQS